MVGTQGNNRVVQNALFLKPGKQIRQGIFQFQIAGDVGLDRIGIIQGNDGLFVAGGHIVAGKAVIQVSAYCHIIGHEGGAVRIKGQGGVHHFPVAGGPYFFHIFLHTVAHSHPYIVTQILVGQIAVVISIGIVVVTVCRITEPL